VSVVAPPRGGVAEERRRIARELHDVVGHNLSLMVIVAQSIGGQEDDAHCEANTIASLGREAMAELARTLDLLRPDAEWAATTSGPSLTDLPKLIDHARLAGIGTDLRIEGTPRPVPANIDLTAYRIVQEALTNVVRHADADRARVTLRYDAERISLEIVDDGAGSTPRTPSRSGRGLAGMLERAALAGGSVDFGVRSGGGFRVVAVLPTVG
jgi:signal transduction histidine kinase